MKIGAKNNKFDETIASKTAFVAKLKMKTATKKLTQFAECLNSERCKGCNPIGKLCGKKPGTSHTTKKCKNVKRVSRNLQRQTMQKS